MSAVRNKYNALSAASIVTVGSATWRNLFDIYLLRVLLAKSGLGCLDLMKRITPQAYNSSLGLGMLLCRGVRGADADSLVL
jgi:hypothetical protein